MTQRFSFYEDLTIRENLDFVARLYALPSLRRDTSTRRSSGLGLTSRQHQLAGTLSGGWKQRLALAACIMHQPRLLLLDEPTAGVDPKARREFWDEIHALAADGPDRARLDPLHGRGRALPPHRLHRLRHASSPAAPCGGDRPESGLHTIVVPGRERGRSPRAPAGHARRRAGRRLRQRPPRRRLRSDRPSRRASRDDRRRLRRAGRARRDHASRTSSSA